MAFSHWFHNLRVKYGVSWWKIPQRLRGKLCFSCDLKTESNAVRWHEESQWTPFIARLSIGASFLDRKFTFSELHYTVCNDVHLVGEHATPILSTGDIVLTSKRDSPALFLEELSAFDNLQSDSKSTAGNSDELVLSLASRLDMVYYHWVTEQLPQVFALIKACSSLDKSPVVYLRKHRPAFQDSSLEALFPDVKVVDYYGETQVQNIILSTIPTMGYAAHPVVLRLRERAFSILGDETDDGPKLIYVKRKIGGWRYILNEDEVLDSLSKLGFKVIDAAEHSFVEQIQMFRSAHCVVSIFGSGLTNILFCKSATIVELAGDYADPCFASLSGHVGNTHTRLKCNSVGDNIVVNVEELQALLTSLNLMNIHC